MLKFYVRNGQIIDTVPEITSFKQNKWLERYKSFNTQKRSQTINDFEKDFYKWLNSAFYGKTMESSRSRLKIKNLLGKIMIKKLSIINHKYTSTDPINFTRIMIVTYLGKMKSLWVRQLRGVRFE